MKKDEFLSQLRKKLSGLPKSDLEDKVSFYEEMINDRMDEGKTEEEAVADIGSTDDAVRQIASETKITTLVKEKIKPKRELKGWEIALLIIGFPLWFPIVTTFFVLLLVGYLMIWILMIVTFAIEIGLIGEFFISLITYMASLFSGNPQLGALGISLGAFGLACLFVFPCIGSKNVCVGLSKKIFLGIKQKIIRGGSNNE